MPASHRPSTQVEMKNQLQVTVSDTENVTALDESNIVQSSSRSSDGANPSALREVQPI